MHKPINIYHKWNISILWWWISSQRCFSRISKAFDKVWHNGLILKLKENWVADDLLDTLTNFFNERNQRVILNGQHTR